MHDIANYKLDKSEYSKYVADINNDIRSGIKKLSASNSAIGAVSDTAHCDHLIDVLKVFINGQNEAQISKTSASQALHDPPHKKLISNYYSLELENANTSGLIKNVNMTCDSLGNFLAFCTAARNQYKKYNVAI